MRRYTSQGTLESTLQRHVSDAERLLVGALRECLELQRSSSPESRHMVARVRRDLERAIDATRSVRSIHRGFEGDTTPTEDVKP